MDPPPTHPISVKLSNREYHPHTTHLTADAVICPAGTLQTLDVFQKPQRIVRHVGGVFPRRTEWEIIVFSQHEGRLRDLW